MCSLQECSNVLKCDHVINPIHLRRLTAVLLIVFSIVPGVLKLCVKPLVGHVVLVSVHVLCIETLSVWFVWAKTGLMQAFSKRNETNNSDMRRTCFCEIHTGACANLTLPTLPFECPQ